MKKIALITVYALAVITVLVNTGFAVKNYLFADINNLPKGELLFSSVSPNGDKTVNIYRVSNVLGNAIRGELEYKGKEAVNFFWQTDMSDVELDWVDNNAVTLDGVPLSADGKTVYDCRNGTALFTDGAIAEDLLEK